MWDRWCWNNCNSIKQQVFDNLTVICEDEMVNTILISVILKVFIIYFFYYHYFQL